MEHLNMKKTYQSRIIKFFSNLSALTLMGTLLLFNVPAAAQDISWTLMPGSMSDVGIGAGVLWGVDSGGKIWRWKSSTNTWTEMPSAGFASRVSVDDRGNAWVVNRDGDVLKWSGSAFERKASMPKDSKNLKRPFSDIGIGANGEVWAVAKFDKQSDSSGVAGSWAVWTGNTWSQALNGEPRSVSVDPQGVAWTVDVKGYISKWDGQKAIMVSGNARAIDVAACPNGDAFIVGTDKAPYKWNGASWDKKAGANLMNIACDAQGKLYATSTSQQVFVGIMTTPAASAAALNKAQADAALAAQEKAKSDAALAVAQAKIQADAAAAAALAKAKSDAAFAVAQAKIQADAAAAAAQAKIQADAAAAVVLAQYKARVKAEADAADAAALAKTLAASVAKLKAEAAAAPFMGCQQMSNTLGFSDGVSFASANALYQQQWILNNCHTKPQVVAPIAAPAPAVSLAAARASAEANNAAICTKNQKAYLANEEIVANNKGNEIQVKIKAAEDEKVSRDKKTYIDYAPNPKFDKSANEYQANQLRLVLANNQKGAQDKIRALTDEQTTWTRLHEERIKKWMDDSRYDKKICP